MPAALGLFATGLACCGVALAGGPTATRTALTCTGGLWLLTALIVLTWS
jgi:hypothetical protein